MYPWASVTLGAPCYWRPQEKFRQWLKAADWADPGDLLRAVQNDGDLLETSFPLQGTLRLNGNLDLLKP